MSDDQELVAAAQVHVSADSPPVVSFNSNFGFESVTRPSAGIYDLELKHEHGIEKLVVHVTPLNAVTVAGAISASLPSKKHIQVNAVNGTGLDPATDTSFFISVLRLRD